MSSGSAFASRRSAIYKGKSDSHVMFVRVAVADLLDLLGIPEQLLSGIVHGRLYTSRLVRGKHFQRDLFGGAEDPGKVQLLANLGDGIDRQGDRRGKGYGVVERDRSRE